MQVSTSGVFLRELFAKVNVWRSWRSYGMKRSTNPLPEDLLFFFFMDAKTVSIPDKPNAAVIPAVRIKLRREKASPQPSPIGEGAESLRFEIFWFLDIFIHLIVFFGFS